VKKLFTYLAVTVFFFSTTGLSQMFKLPILMAHYVEHVKRDHHLGMLDFLSMHYWGQDLNDNDQDRDMQLPFKSPTQHCCSQISLIPPAGVVTIDHHYFVPSKPVQPIVEDSFYIMNAASSLFRPPRA
jgi:hypothetical protein